MMKTPRLAWTRYLGSIMLLALASGCVGLLTPSTEPLPTVTLQPLSFPQPILRHYGNVHFALNSASTTPEMRVTLTRLAQRLQRRARTRVRLVGHASTDGNARHNQRLALRRAEAVKAYLAKQGVQAQRMATVSLGETQPFSATPADNRRVEIILIVPRKG